MIIIGYIIIIIKWIENLLRLPSLIKNISKMYDVDRKNTYDEDHDDAKNKNCNQNPKYKIYCW